MRVFKACITIMKRRALTFIVYLIVFLLLCVVITAMSAQKSGGGFEAVKPTYTFINRDTDSELIRGLKAYLDTHASEVPLADEKEALQDASFFHASDYILIVPQGFAASVYGGDARPLQTVTVPDSANGYYVDRLVNQYLRLDRNYALARPDESAAQRSAAVLADLSRQSQVEKSTFAAAQPFDESYRMYVRMQGYILIVLVLLLISTVFIVFRRPDLNRRILASPLKPGSMYAQMLLYGAIVSIAAWLALQALGYVIYGPRLAGVDIRTLALINLNTLVYTAVALALALLSSTFLKSFTMQNALANFLSLGLSFLGGAFVPLELFGPGMITAAKFTPTYWYITALDQLIALRRFDWAALAPVISAMLMQLGFALAISCIAMVLAKYKNRSEGAYQSAKTELDA